MSDLLTKSESGLGPMAVSLTIDEAKTYRLTVVTCKFDVAPTTSEDYTITKNCVTGTVYDPLLYTVDPSILSATSVVWYPDGEEILRGGDAVDVAYDNTDDRQWGVEIHMMRVHP